MIVWPMETWPSPPITAAPALRTVRTVVPCQRSKFWGCMGHRSIAGALIYALRRFKANLRFATGLVARVERQRNPGTVAALQGSAGFRCAQSGLRSSSKRGADERETAAWAASG